MNRSCIEFQITEMGNGWWQITVIKKGKERPLAAFLYRKDAEEFLRWKQGLARISEAVHDA